jgi:hypothetical protein
VRSSLERPNSIRALVKSMLRALPPSMSTFLKHTF